MGGPDKNKLCVYLLQRGISTLLGRMYILSIAHTKEDIDKTVDALVDAIGAAMADGVLKDQPVGKSLI